MDDRQAATRRTEHLIGHLKMSQKCVADYELDITAELCPMGYVRTRLALDRLLAGQVLAVRLRGADTLRNVPLSAIRQGHTVLACVHMADDVTVVSIRRGPSPA